MSVDDALAELAALHGCSIATAQRVVAGLCAQAGTEWFYVFWVSGAGGPGGAGSRSRRILAFATPDSALSFAQRNHLIDVAAGPRLRRLNLARLLLAMGRAPAITSLLLVRDGDMPPAPHQLPDGITVERADLARLMTNDE